MLTNSFANQILKLLLAGQAIPGFAAPAGTGNLTQLWVGMHTSDPGAGGTQETAECNYTGYTRIAVNRNNLAWTFAVAGASASPVARIEFPEVRGGNQQEATYLSFGTSRTGAGLLLLRGELDPVVTCLRGVTPGVKNTATIRFLTDKITDKA